MSKSKKNTTHKPQTMIEPGFILIIIVLNIRLK